MRAMLRDLEAVASLRFFCGDLDRAHDRAWGTVSTPSHHLFDRAVAPFEHGLDPSVGEVADPSANPGLLRGVRAGLPEPDALDPTADPHVFARDRHHRFRLRPSLRDGSHFLLRCCG